jgi:hypothetical protein
MAYNLQLSIFVACSALELVAQTNQALLTSFARKEKSVFGVVGMVRSPLLVVYTEWVPARAKRNCTVGCNDGSVNLERGVSKGREMGRDQSTIFYP